MCYIEDTLVLFFFPPENWYNGQAAVKIREKSEDYLQCSMLSKKFK